METTRKLVRYTANKKAFFGIQVTSYGNYYAFLKSLYLRYNPKPNEPWSGDLLDLPRLIYASLENNNPTLQTIYWKVIC